MQQQPAEYRRVRVRTGDRVASDGRAEDWTEKNIAEMKNQLVRLGISFDWEREVGLAVLGGTVVV